MIEIQDKSLRKYKKVLISALSSIFTIVLVLGVIAIGITGSKPCLYTKCHEKAVCINHPFNAECVCLYGYNGNGKDHCDECGLTYFQQNATLNPGRAVPYSWPATTHIQFVYTDFERLGNFSTAVSYSGICAGVLINRRTVLTLASCFRKRFQYFDQMSRKTYTIEIEPNEFYPNINAIHQVYLGVDSYVYYNQDLEYVFHSGVEKVTRHPNFNETTFENNIAIIKLRQTIPLIKQIQVACLPNETSSSTPEITKSYGYIAGFSTSGSTFGSWNMQNVELDLYYPYMCANVRPNNPKNWKQQFCAGEYDVYLNTTGFCHGDYGSAIYTNETVNGVVKLIATGLLSYDVPCSTTHSPAIFTRISYYLDWIKQNSNY